MPKTVLIVDDLFETTTLIALALERAGGYQCLKAHHAQEALSLLENHTPDLIISDNIMPGMDGYEFCRLTRQRDDLRQVPFIMINYTGRDEVMEKSRAAGADHIWTLPLNFRALPGMVAAVLGATN